jgi:prevent-host-death family protein
MCSQYEVYMVSVGVRELKRRASELIRMVRENGSEIQVTYHGKVVALLVPAASKEITPQETETWTEIDHLAAEIGAHWPQGVSVTQTIQEIRQ